MKNYLAPNMTRITIRDRSSRFLGHCAAHSIPVTSSWLFGKVGSWMRKRCAVRAVTCQFIPIPTFVLCDIVTYSSKIVHVTWPGTSACAMKPSYKPVVTFRLIRTTELLYWRPTATVSPALLMEN